VTAALCLLATVFLPWVTWGFSYQQYSGLGLHFSLWQAVVDGAAGDLGVTCTYAVAAGMVVAAVGSVLEAVERPTGTATRWLTLGGFVLASGSAGLGVMSIVSQLAATPTDYPTGGFTFGIALGLWLGLGLAVIGAVLSIMHLSAPPNPRRAPEPFAPSPWGPLPGQVPPGFHPALGREWLDYLERGQVPPGYVPPSYGPAVYPMPGYVAPAYPTPDRPDGPAPAAPVFPPTAGAGGTEAGPTPGRLVVLEAGRSFSYTVRPGERMLVGRDPDAQIRLSDPRVGARHATIERRGDGWAIQDVDATRPTRLIDSWGTNRPVRGEMVIPAGQLVMGGVTVTIYSNQG
jgi:hypothetical protein